MTLEEDVKRFFQLLNLCEESDSGYSFKPNNLHINSCRIMDGIELSEILDRMEHGKYD